MRVGAVLVAPGERWGDAAYGRAKIDIAAAGQRFPPCTAPAARHRQDVAWVPARHRAGASVKDVAAAWCAFVAVGGRAMLAAMVAEDVVLYSPFSGRPLWGARAVSARLSSMRRRIGPGKPRQLGIWRHGRSAVVEHSGEVEGRDLHGVTILHWDAEGTIVDITIMVRPLGRPPG